MQLAHLAAFSLVAALACSSSPVASPEATVPAPATPAAPAAPSAPCNETLLNASDSTCNFGCSSRLAAPVTIHTTSSDPVCADYTVINASACTLTPDAVCTGSMYCAYTDTWGNEVSCRCKVTADGFLVTGSCNGTVLVGATYHGCDYDFASSIH